MIPENLFLRSIMRRAISQI